MLYVTHIHTLHVGCHDEHGSCDTVTLRRCNPYCVLCMVVFDFIHPAAQSIAYYDAKYARPYDLLIRKISTMKSQEKNTKKPTSQEKPSLRL